MINDTVFQPADSDNNLLRKILTRLNLGISTSGGGGAGGATQIQDGTASGNARVLGASTPNLTTDPALLVRIGDGDVRASVANGADVTQGSTIDAAATDSTSAWTVVSLLKGLFARLVINNNVGGYTFTAKINPTISTSAYSAGFTVGAIQTLTNAVRKSGGTAILESLTLLDKSNQKAAMDIFIFDVNPAAATTTDHAAFAFSTNDVNVIARVSVAATDYVTVNSEAVAVKSGLGIAVQASGSANLYAVAVTSGTPTYAATALQWVWGLLQD